MDSGCLGNLVAFRVPTTTGGRRTCGDIVCLGNLVALRVPTTTGGRRTCGDIVCLRRLERAVVKYIVNRSFVYSSGKYLKVHICLLLLSGVVHSVVLEQWRE